MKVLSQNESKYMEFNSAMICPKGYICSVDEVRWLQCCTPSDPHDIRIFTPWGKSFYMGTYENAERARAVFTDLVMAAENNYSFYSMPKA